LKPPHSTSTTAGRKPRKRFEIGWGMALMEGGTIPL
jgi:hypothetical protein